MAGRNTPQCIEPGCEAKCPPRQNYHAMSEDYALDASPFHHRCRKHYAAWLVSDIDKTTTVRKNWACEGCGHPISAGDTCKVGLRSAGLRTRYPERVYVCLACAELPTAIEPAGAGA